MKSPTPGRIVLYTDAELINHNAGRLTAPAIVTGVADDELTVNLTVFADGGRVAPAAAVPHHSIATDGESSWEWPELVDDHDGEGEPTGDGTEADGENAGQQGVPRFP